MDKDEFERLKEILTKRHIIISGWCPTCKQAPPCDVSILFAVLEDHIKVKSPWNLKVEQRLDALEGSDDLA